MQGNLWQHFTLCSVCSSPGTFQGLALLPKPTRATAILSREMKQWRSVIGEAECAVFGVGAPKIKPIKNRNEREG